MDLFYPCKEAQFFPNGLPASEAALCAEMARLAYFRSTTGFLFDRERIQSVLRGVGFADCQFFESSGTPQGGGTHCFLAFREDKETRTTLAIVAFRGTDAADPTNLTADLKFRMQPWEKGGKVHTGFAQALADVRRNLEPALASLDCRVLFTGHSLGAVLATLLASLRKPGALYTFGSPRVGDGTFVMTLNEVANYRYVDCCDVVTRIPPKQLGYEHLGNPHYIDRDRRVVFNPDPAVIRADRIRAAAEYIVKHAWIPGNVGARELADHAPFNYVSPLAFDSL